MTAVIKKIKINNTNHDIHDSRISGIDSSVTQGSSNLVTSGAVYDKIDDIPVVEGTKISSIEQTDSFIPDTAQMIMPLFLTGAAGATTYSAHGPGGMKITSGNYYQAGDAISYGDVFTKIVSLSDYSITLKETLSSESALNETIVTSYYRKTNTATGIGSSALGIQTSASGLGAHSEGQNTSASGDYSHAEGWGTQTLNEGEHAEGRYNKSTVGHTISSIGIGISGIRKNALEVMQNGDIYVYGVGDYDGTDYNSSSTLQSVISGHVETEDMVLLTDNDIDTLWDAAS